MAYVKNNWVDREGTTRYFETVDDDGVLILTPDYTQVTEMGTPVNADNMNHIEDGIAAGSFTKYDSMATYAKNDLVTTIVDNELKVYKSLQDNNTNTLDNSSFWEEVEFSGGGGAGLQLFDTILKDHVLTYEETKGLALQGTYVYKEAIAGSRYGYPDFYNKCVEEYDEATTTETVNGVTVKVHSNGHKFYDIADKGAIDTFFSTMGTAWFYGVDTENERIFLPRNNYATSYIADGDKTVSVYGTGKALGLTNGSVNASLGYVTTGSKRLFASATVNPNIGATVADGVSQGDQTAFGVSKDGTRSGLTGLVNLQNTQNGMYLYICVGNTTSYEGMTEVVNQGMEILEQVNQGIESRVKVDGSNAEFPYIVETYRNGQSWYRVYSDGWVEQGGHVNVTNGTSGYAVALLKPVMHYNVLLTMATNAYGTVGWGVSSKTTTQFSIFCNIDTSRGCAWRADGWLYEGE